MPELPDKEFVDTGLVADTPLKPALAHEPETALVASAFGINRPAPPPENLGAAIALVAEKVGHFASRADLRHAETVIDLVEAKPDVNRTRVDLAPVEPQEVSFSAPAFLRSTGRPRCPPRHQREARPTSRSRTGSYPSSVRALSSTTVISWALSATKVRVIGGSPRRCRKPQIASVSGAAAATTA